MFKWLAGFRKFAMALLFLFVAVALLLGGVVPGDTWMEHMSSVMVAFMATNVSEHIINVAKDWVKQRREKDNNDTES